MKDGDSIKVTLPGNVFLVGQYKRTDMWGNIEGYVSGALGSFIETQLGTVAIYYMKTSAGISFSVDSGRVTLIESYKDRGADGSKCECGTEAVGGTRCAYYCPRFRPDAQEPTSS